MASDLTEAEPDDDPTLWDEETAVAAQDLGSGYLTQPSRAEAVVAALPFVATYFVRSDQLQLRPTDVLASRPSAAIGRREQPPDTLLAALRLRAALSAGAVLAETLQALVRSANFQLERVLDEHVGHLHGRLDVSRYIQQRSRRSVPRRYPVVDLQRSSATPENALAAFALHWMIAELDTCLVVLTALTGTPELTAASDVRAALVRLTRNPTIRGATQAAEHVARRETVGQLLERVEARLRAGHVTRTGPYEHLVAWVQRSLTGEPQVGPGDLTAAFYGPRFDDKLFELWCLTELEKALSRLLGQPRLASPHMLQRDARSPLFTWDAGAETIELYFQPALAELVGADNRWRYQPSDQPLRGFPDLGARCRRVDGSVEVVLLDAKLRRRRGARGQELYKLLGYMANAGAPVHRGALIFHEPTGFHPGTQHWSIKRPDTDEPGLIEMVAVDPGDHVGSPQAFALLAQLVITATGIPSGEVSALVAAGADDPDADTAEREGARAQALATAQMNVMAQQLPTEVLAATEGHLQALLDDRWPMLGAAVQRMVTTAVHFGVTAPDGADLAGPVLGLCSALERLLRENLAVPALSQVSGHEGCDPNRWTMGTLIRRLQEAITDPTWRAPRALRHHMVRSGVDLSELGRLLAELDWLREVHRNNAAHRGLVERAQWNEVYRTVLRADAALLPRLARTVHGPQGSSPSPVRR